MSVTGLSDSIRFERILALAFRFNASDIPLGVARVVAELDGESHRHVDPSTTIRVDMRRLSAGADYCVTAFPDTGSAVDTDWQPIPDGVHNFTVQWTRGSGPAIGDGLVEIWVDGQPRDSLSSVDLFWRHHPTFYRLDDIIVDTQHTSMGQTVPMAYWGPAIPRRRNAWRRR